MPGSRGRSFRRRRATHQLSLRLAQTFASSGSTWPPSDVNALVQLISLPAPTLAMLPKRDSGPLLLSSVSASAPLVFSVSVVEPDEELSAMGAAGACADADACRFVFGNARASFFSFRSFSAFCNAARAR